MIQLVLNDLLNWLSHAISYEFIGYQGEIYFMTDYQSHLLYFSTFKSPGGLYIQVTPEGFMIGDSVISKEDVILRIHDWIVRNTV